MKCVCVFKTFQDRRRRRFKTPRIRSQRGQITKLKFELPCLGSYGCGGLIAPTRLGLIHRQVQAENATEKLRVSLSLSLSPSLSFYSFISFALVLAHSHAHTHTHALSLSPVPGVFFLQIFFSFFLSKAVFSKFLETLTQCLKSVKTIFVLATNKS